MTDAEYEKRVDAGVHELCDLAKNCGVEEAEEFFQAIAYRASNRFRRVSRESVAE